MYNIVAFSHVSAAMRQRQMDKIQDILPLSHVAHLGSTLMHTVRADMPSCSEERPI